MNVRTLRILTLATATLLSSASAPASASTPVYAGTPVSAGTPASAAVPCGLLTPEQIKTVLGAPVQPGKPGENDCTWKDAGGHDRVYLSLKDAKDWKSFRDSMQATGRMTPVTGVAEDAFFVASSGTSAAFYTLKRGHVVLLTVDGLGFTRAQNEASEKTLAPQILQGL